MSLHWFRISAIARNTITDALTRLEPLGIALKPAVGRCYYECDDESGAVMKAIGDLTVYRDGRIVAWPYNGTTDEDVSTLLAAAEEGWRNRPSKASGWTLRRGKTAGTYWAATVLVEVRPWEDTVAILIARERERRDEQNVLDLRSLLEQEVTGT